MRFEVDPARILYIIGAMFGIAAVVYFARDIVFDLSITVRALLLLLAFIALFVAATTTARSSFTLVGYVLSAAAYVAFLGYTLSRFDVGADGTFLALLVSAMLFLALGYAMRERELSMPTRRAQIAVVGVALIGAAFVGADVLASEVDYAMAINDEADVTQNGEIDVGTVTVDNRFAFREPIDMPSAHACIYVPEVAEYDMRPQPVQYRVGGDRVPDSVAGFDTLSVSMTIRLNDEEVESVGERLPIEDAAECPNEAVGPRIVVVVGDDIPRPIPA